MNVHIYPSYFTNESRILRIVECLGKYRVFNEFLIIAIFRKDLPAEEAINDNSRVTRIAPAFGRTITGKLGHVIKAVGWYVAAFRKLLSLPGLQCVNCHSLSVLPLGVLAKWFLKCKLVYDTHELETEVVSSRGLRKRLAKIAERLMIGQCDAVSVVNHSIAQWYKEQYKLGEVAVVRNMPKVQQRKIAATGKLRALIGVTGPEERIYLYQGLLTAGRGIPILLDVFRQMDAKQHLVFMGYGDMESTISAAADRHPNIHWVPAVPPEEVLAHTSDADVGLSLIENVCLSYYYCLPNKVFEYAACGVPSLVSNFPEMSRFIEESAYGWTVEPGVATVLEKLRSIDHQSISDIKKHIQASPVRYSWESEEAALLAIYSSLGYAIQDIKPIQ